MTVQYTSAALASENKVLAHPACVDSIPTSANFEDFVSMGVTAAEKARKILENIGYIVDSGCRITMCSPSDRIPRFRKAGKGTKMAYSTIRKAVPKLKEDRALSEDVEKIRQTIKKRVILDEIEKALKLE